jgi:hypothetical protein
LNLKTRLEVFVFSYSSFREAPAKALACRALVMLFAGVLIACSDASAPRTNGPAVRIVPLVDSVFEGDVVHLAARVFDETGAEVPGAPVTWSVSDTSVAHVASDGTLTTARAGALRIRAQSGAITGSYDLSVARLVVRQIVTDPSAMSLGRGDRVQVAARVLGQGGREIKGRHVLFSTDDSSVAVIGSPDNVIGSPGFLIATGPGSTTIHATLDGVTGSSHVGVVIADTTYFNGVAIPALVASDSVEFNGVREFDEVYADQGTFVLSGLLQERYKLTVHFTQYHVFEVGGVVQREPRLQFVGEVDHGIVTVGENGNLTMLSEFIGPHLEHTATLQPDGYLVHFQEPGDNFVLQLTYRRVTP